MDNFLFLGCTGDGEEYYLKRSECRDGKVFFCMYRGYVVYDIDTSIRTKLEDDILLQDLQETFGHMVTNEYINDKRDLLLRHYFHTIPGLDNCLFWNVPRVEFNGSLQQNDKVRLISRIQSICGIRTDEYGQEWTDFSDEYVLYDEVYDFIAEAFKEQIEEKKEENKRVVYKHI